jgi:hypothetical protein
MFSGAKMPRADKVIHDHKVEIDEGHSYSFGSMLLFERTELFLA